MRRYIKAVAFLCAGIIALFSSCVQKEESVPYRHSEINAAMLTFENGGDVYEAKVTLDGEIPEEPSRNRESTVTFVSPKEIEGLTVKYSPAGGEVSVGGVAYALSGDMGCELYRVVRLFSLGSEEIRSKEISGNTSLVNYVVSMDGCDVSYEVSYVDGIPASADISWQDGRIKVLSITPCE